LTPTTTSTAIVPFDPVFAGPERLALGGFLAGYSVLTRDAYELDLRQYVALTTMTWTCSRPGVQTSRRSHGSSSGRGEPGRRSPAAGAR